MKIPLVIGCVLVCTLSGITAADENFRCGKWVVSSSATVYELVQKCGQPAKKESRKEDVQRMNDSGHMIKIGETLIETWTFDRGTQAAAMVATIVDGRIKSLERKQ